MHYRLAPALIVLLSACGGSQTQEVVGSPVSADAMVLRLEEGGRLYRNGAPAILEDLVADMKWDAASISDPIVIDVDPTLRLRECNPLLRTLVIKGQRTNIGFLADTSRGRRCVLIPIIRESTPSRLSVRVGRTVYEDSFDQRHLWVEVRIGQGGGASVTRVRQGYLEPEFAGTGRPGPQWNGSQPPGGSWSDATFRDFLENPEIRALSPFVKIEAVMSDAVGDFVACLDRLHAIAPGRVIVDFRLN